MLSSFTIFFRLYTGSGNCIELIVKKLQEYFSPDAAPGQYISFLSTIHFTTNREVTCFPSTKKEKSYICTSGAEKL